MTAIEFLAESIYSNKEFSLSEIFEKAKEMEKQQLYKFYVQGGIDCITQADRTVEDYYNQTYKNTNK